MPPNNKQSAAYIAKQATDSRPSLFKPPLAHTMKKRLSEDKLEAMLGMRQLQATLRMLLRATLAQALHKNSSLHLPCSPPKPSGFERHQFETGQRMLQRRRMHQGPRPQTRHEFLTPKRGLSKRQGSWVADHFLFSFSVVCSNKTPHTGCAFCWG